MHMIEKRVKKIIAEQLDIKESDIHNTNSFLEDLNADSLDSIELIMKLEEEFKIDIPDEVSESFDTVEKVIKYIKQST
ncbi:MAG TPA: acyl carrier protein [Buchnera sp. (in: enterobacteria)]|nr:acyl carrier protein [Buchnera sp. (in: enterobacteria)]